MDLYFGDWAQLTLGLNRVPFMPGLVGRLGLFRPIRNSSTLAMIEVQGSRLTLVPELPRGSPPTVDVADRRAMVGFRIPHFPIRTTIYADAIQNRRAFGTTSELQSFPPVVEERLTELGRKLDYTLEHLRLGALMGKVVTAADRVTGDPEIALDLFASFDVAPRPEIEWPIINAGAIGQEQAAWAGDLTGLCNDLWRRMALEVPAGLLAGIHGICGSVFYDAFTRHPDRRAMYIGFPAAERELAAQQVGRTIEFQGVTVQEYMGHRISGAPLVPPDLCYFIPLNIPDMFVEIYAPADCTDTVNTEALPRYVRRQDIDFEKGIELEAQMNVLPLMTMPRAMFVAKAVPYQP